MGFNTDALSLASTALGFSTDATGLYSTSLGFTTRAQAPTSLAIGRYNIGNGTTDAWVSTDPIFEIGIGSSSANRANAVTVRKNGNVGIGTSVPLDRLHVNGRVRLQTVEYFEDGGTSEIAVRGDLRPSADNTYDIGTSSLRYDDVYATSGTVNTSDAREKKNISNSSYGISEVMNLKPVSFEWKSRNTGKKKLGLLAQDVI